MKADPLNHSPGGLTRAEYRLPATLPDAARVAMDFLICVLLCPFIGRVRQPTRTRVAPNHEANLRQSVQFECVLRDQYASACRDQPIWGQSCVLPADTRPLPVAPAVFVPICYPNAPRSGGGRSDASRAQSCCGP